MSLPEAVKDIKDWLSKGLYSNEQHVRFSLLGRILNELGWNVWNPEIFNTEYTITVPDNSDNHHGTTRTYKVDIALCKKSSQGTAPHMLIEVKGVDMNTKQAYSGRNQLELYSSKFSSISILTDGRSWEFYLNSLKTINSPFESCMISKVNLSDDNIDSVCELFLKLISYDITNKQLDKIGRIMRREFVIEQFIFEALPEAISTGHDRTMRSQDVFSIIKSNHKQEKISQPEFQKVWKDLLAKGKLKIDPPPPALHFHIKVKDMQAYCIYDKDKSKFVVKAGSEVRMTTSDSSKDNFIDERNQLIANGDLKHDKKTGKYILTRDKSFETPSGASRFVLGRASNGWDDWLDEKNQPLQNYRQSLSN
jgi:predicted type IV restriction endonuclease